MEIQKSFGPLTPQEFKRASKWLDQNQIEFTQFIDKEIEKKFTENSPANIVNQAEFRTQTYLGSVFYIQILDISSEKETEFRKLLQILPDQIPDKFKSTYLNINFERTDPERNKKIERFIARMAIVGILIYILYKYSA